MKHTLLKMTQLILASMDSDEVNSIFDTAESLQVVDAIETTYWDLVSTMDFPDHWDFFELEATTDVAKPTLMYLPSDVQELEWVQYNNSDTTNREFYSVTPMEREHFFKRMNNLDSSEDYVYQYNLLVGAETFDVRGRNDRHPTYYTTMDDNTLVFDSYNAESGPTLMKNRTHCYGMKVPQFVREDDFIPDFPARQFSLLFNEAKSQSHIELKQIENRKAEQRARMAKIHSQRTGSRVKVGSIYHHTAPNFGRR